MPVIPTSTTSVMATECIPNTILMALHLAHRTVCLKGNHEDIMWQCCRQPIKAGWWMDNGGGATLIDFRASPYPGGASTPER
jgi:hypothetical protein